MRFITVLFVAILMLGCKKKEAPKPPEKAKLVFPVKNSECTTGQSISSSSSQVEFKWQAANETETYKVIVTNLITGTKQEISTKSTVAKIPLDKGAPYSWVVTSQNSNFKETASSETWQFYNSGIETTYAPFSAEIIEPKMGASAIKDINNDVVLKWNGADVDNDIIGFEVYFSTENPPETVVASLGADEESTPVAVTSETVYYWKVITKDTEGNTSDSGIFEFQAF